MQIFLMPKLAEHIMSNDITVMRCHTAQEWISATEYAH